MQARPLIHTKPVKKIVIELKVNFLTQKHPLNLYLLNQNSVFSTTNMHCFINVSDNSLNCGNASEDDTFGHSEGSDKIDVVGGSTTPSVETLATLQHTTPNKLQTAETQRAPGINGLELDNMCQILQHVFAHALPTNGTEEAMLIPCLPTDPNNTETSGVELETTTQPEARENKTSGSVGSLVKPVHFAVSGVISGSVSFINKKALLFKCS